MAKTGKKRKDGKERKRTTKKKPDWYAIWMYTNECDPLDNGDH